ncbi:MAG: hypothetical protein LC772_09685 [Chloroflexi bacterium]|nr:hypothetical protein [Chloroflexota bacterium]
MRRKHRAQACFPGRRAGYGAARASVTLRGGFSLPEVLSAMSLLVVGAFSSFSLLTLAIECDKEAADFTTARTIATTQLEAIRASQTRLAAGSTSISGVSTSLGTGATGTLSVTREESTGQTALDLVTVTLTWPEPGRGTVSLTDSTFVCSGGVSAS